NQQAAHRRRAGRGPMRDGPFLPDHLADLELAQLAHHPWTKHQTDRQRRQTRRCRPKRDVTRHVQHGELRVEWKQKMEEHYARSAFSRSTTRSVLTPRDPFTRIRSPGRTSSTIAFAASSLAAKCR